MIHFFCKAWELDKLQALKWHKPYYPSQKINKPSGCSAVNVPIFMRGLSAYLTTPPFSKLITYQRLCFDDIAKFKLFISCSLISLSALSGLQFLIIRHISLLGCWVFYLTRIDYLSLPKSTSDLPASQFSDNLQSLILIQNQGDLSSKPSNF
ncbi:hypothetical protein [Moraxella cuniculi]|uniref:hypothetical protein n=1 Tax=Moraxella cuniculi TaxID=34061 RepID=UPI000F81E694|nr:hypothetical protein [Moraxella cuniculi]